MSTITANDGHLVNGNTVPTSGIWTLEKIAYAVKNNIEAGLKTTANHVFSMEQMREEIIAERNAVIERYRLSNAQLDLSDMEQEINCIELDCKKFDLCCGGAGIEKPQLHFVVPKFSSLSYVGLTDQVSPFKRYTGSAHKYAAYRDPRLRKRTYVRFRLYEGRQHGFIFNPPSNMLKNISVRGVFENPFDVNIYECCGYDYVNDRFPVPDFMVREIIDSMVGKWSSWMYRFQGPRPNTQNPVI